MGLRKALVEFDLTNEDVIARFDITKLDNPCVVYLTGYREVLIEERLNRELPWLEGACLFEYCRGKCRFEVIMEIPV